MARVVVFVDYENMHRCARHAFGTRNGHFWPWALGEELVARRTAAGHPGTLHQVRVYRGLPSSRLQPVANAANQAQQAAWKRSPGVYAYTRPLRYLPSWPAPGSVSEKGVDVALAADLIQMAYQGGYDVGIVCSHDSDLAPALDVVGSIRTSRVHLECVSWSGQPRINFTDRSVRMFCHYLDAATFEKVRDSSTYP